jgi:replicative DNA helicase
MTSPAFNFTDAGPAASPLGAGMPSNIDAEQALLGALLYDNAAYERTIDKLQASHFYEPFHQRLFAVMVDHFRL